MRLFPVLLASKTTRRLYANRESRLCSNEVRSPRFEDSRRCSLLPVVATQRATLAGGAIEIRGASPSAFHFEGGRRQRSEPSSTPQGLPEDACPSFSL